LKYAQAKYNGIANFKLGLPYKLSKNYSEGEPKLIKPIANEIDLKVFSCSIS
jgi:hypothetical protein